MDSQQDVRDVLARIVRIESTLYTLSNASQTTHNAICQSHNVLNILQASMQHMMGLLVVAPPVIQHVQQPLATVNNAAAANGTQPPGPSAAPVSAVIGEPTSSQEAHALCPFAACSCEVRNCSAAKSLRHMQTCQHCPEPFYRYLHIAQHMCSFQKHPRVTDLDVCCWCDVQFQADQSDDSRSRHRHACRDKATLSLQDANTCQSMSNRLQQCWAVNLVAAPQKRRCRALIPFSPPVNPAMPPAREPDREYYHDGSEDSP
jgi:hypothetical protein